MPPRRGLQETAQPRPWNGVDHWVLDKRINLAMLGGFLLFCVVNVGTLFTLAYRVALLEEQYKALAPQQLQIIRLEDSVKALQDRFDDKLASLSQIIKEGLADVKRLVVAQWPPPVHRPPVGATPPAASRLP